MRIFSIFAAVILTVAGSISQAHAAYFNDGDMAYMPYDDSSCCCNKFDGFYVGGNLGVISHTSHRSDFNAFFIDSISTLTTIRTNFIGGGQIGYDWSCENILVGFVADFNGISTKHKGLNDVGFTGIRGDLRNDAKWLTTIRTRFGLKVCNALAYVTVGAAGIKAQNRYHFENFAIDTFQQNKFRWGWTGGAGTELMVWNNFSIGAEVLFCQFSDRHSSFIFEAQTFAFGASDSAWIGRFTFNYRFGDLFNF